MSVGRDHVGHRDSRLPRRGAGRSFPGARMAAVSAMKWTPQKTMTRPSTAAAFSAELERIADEIGDVLDLAPLIVVGEQDGVPRLGPAPGPAGESAALIRRRRSSHHGPAGRAGPPQMRAGRAPPCWYNCRRTGIRRDRCRSVCRRRCLQALDRALAVGTGAFRRSSAVMLAASGRPVRPRRSAGRLAS